jgi:hypothetical protein
MSWTVERVKALSPGERWTLYSNAMKLSTPPAAALVRLIDEAGLPLSSGGGLPAEHPTIMAIREVVMGPRGVQAGIDAIQKGLPALAGVDPLLQVEVPGYSAPDTHSWAGTFVAEAMEMAGYRRTKPGPLPPTCKAKTAMRFERKGRPSIAV